MTDIDWTLSNTRIASAHNLHPREVARLRSEAGVPLPTGRGYPKRRHLPHAKGSVRIITDLDFEFAFKSSGKDNRVKGSKAWKRAVLNHYGDACTTCGYRRLPISNHCHHRVALKDGGKNTIRNGIVLCSRCHDEVHAGLISLDRPTISIPTGTLVQ